MKNCLDLRSYAMIRPKGDNPDGVVRWTRRTGRVYTQASRAGECTHLQ